MMSHLVVRHVHWTGQDLKKWIFWQKVDILAKSGYFSKKWIFWQKSGYFGEMWIFSQNVDILTDQSEMDYGIMSHDSCDSPWG